MSDMWVDAAEDPRTSGDPVGEKATLAEYLTNYRLTLGMKCDGLDAERLARRSVPPSTLSLLGLVRHMAYVEHRWFQRALQGKDEPSPFVAADDRDADFNGAVADPAVVEEAFATWKQQIAAADAWLETLDEADLGRTVPLGGEESASIRDILVHMVEEYARHAGHADLLRECIDGRTGQ
jgi:uncharacterized damage-inducible protein DinB